LRACKATNISLLNNICETVKVQDPEYGNANCKALYSLALAAAAAIATAALLAAEAEQAAALAQAQKPYFLMKAPEKPLEGVKRVAILDFGEENNNYYYDRYDGRGKKTTDQLLQAWMQDQRGVDKVSVGLFKVEDGETFQKGVKTSIFSFVERTEMERILKEQQLGMSGVIDDSQATAVGKILGIDALIYIEETCLKHLYNDYKISSFK
jgi:curli biogenesis system outer membrane secretion channel CsgG